MFLAQFAFNFMVQGEAFLLILLMLSAISLVNKDQSWGYILGLSFSIFLSARAMFVATFRYQEYIGIFTAMSSFYLWHCHLEFVYNRLQGYLTIVLHQFGWWYLGYSFVPVKSSMPHDVALAFLLLLCLQFIWYNYHVNRDYQELTTKIELETSETNVKNLINAIPEGIAVLNEKLEVLMCNNATAKLIQTQSIFELMINQKFNNKQKNTSHKLMKYVREFKDSQETSTTFGVCSVEHFYLECTGSKTTWNNVLAIVLTFREVSNIIKLENEVNLNSKTLKILQGISHELKTPLNKMINDLQEVLRSSEMITESMRVYLQRAYSSSKHILSLVKDMIDYSHIKFKNLGLNLEWMSVDEMILECIQMCKDINRKYQIVYRNQNIKRSSIYTDHSRFKQCILNLMFFALG